MERSDSEQENNTLKWETTQQRKLCYRELLNKLEQIEESEDLGLNTVKNIGEIIKQVNHIENEHNINERYEHPDEILLDSKVLSSSSNVLIKCIEYVDIDSYTYTSSDFASKIISFCKDGDEFEAENLIKLLSDAQNIIPQTPQYNFLYGTYDLYNLPQPKQKKERQKQKKEEFQRKEPEKVTNLDKEEQGIDEIIKVLYEVLTECYENNQKRPIKYYDYVIDTSSFEKTVENIFYCSFLVRDGRAHITLDSKNEPYIKPMKKRNLKEYRDSGGGNSQIISVITMTDWERFTQEGYIQKHKNSSR